MVSSHSKSTGIPRVDGLSMGPSDLGRHNYYSCRVRVSEYSVTSILTRPLDTNYHPYMESSVQNFTFLIDFL